MPEAFHTIPFEAISSLPIVDVPGWPEFKWLPSDFGNHIPVDTTPSRTVDEIQLTAYALPWTLASVSERVYYAHLNPNWGLLDLIGGRLNPLYEWPVQTFETVQREAIEEVQARLLDTLYDRQPSFYLLNMTGKAFGPIFQPLLATGGAGKLIPIPPLVDLNEKTATRRLLATLSVIDHNPSLLKVS